MPDIPQFKTQNSEINTPEGQPDPDQGHTPEWPSTPYSDEARLEEPGWQEACCIGLFGDCTVANELWPLANRPEQHLAVRLRRAFPAQPFLIRNVAASGESAGDFLNWRIEPVVSALPRLDVAFIRYGINDRKQHGIAGCIANLRQLCTRLQAQFAGVTLIIETGMWVDYPAHYLWDRNTPLASLYAAMATFAAEAGIPLLDLFHLMQHETRRGNWDLRVRGLPTPEHTVLDDSFDAFYGEDAAFFTNIHPNSRGMGLIAAWEVALLRELFGETLDHDNHSALRR